jgi:hypothetical protein
MMEARLPLIATASSGHRGEPGCPDLSISSPKSRPHSWAVGGHQARKTRESSPSASTAKPAGFSAGAGGRGLTRRPSRRSAAGHGRVIRCPLSPTSTASRIPTCLLPEVIRIGA